MATGKTKTYKTYGYSRLIPEGWRDVNLNDTAIDTTSQITKRGESNRFLARCDPDIQKEGGVETIVKGEELTCFEVGKTISEGGQAETY